MATKIESANVIPMVPLNPYRIPLLDQYEIQGVTSANKSLGRGSCSEVEEVTIPKIVCKQMQIKWSSVFASKKFYYKNKEDYEAFNSFFTKNYCALMVDTRHDKLAQFHGIWYPPGDLKLPALVMERAASTLEEKLMIDDATPRAIIRFPSRRKLSVLVDVTEALVFLHQKSIVHRNLTAKNILVTRDGVGKISDYGMANIVKTSPKNSSYLPPEATDSHQKDSTSIDVFSFGVVVLYTATGEYPHPIAATVCDSSGNITARSEVQRRKESFTSLSTTVFGDEIPSFTALVKDCLNNVHQRRPKASQLREKLRVMKDNRLRGGDLKVVVIGGPGVGKTALMLRYKSVPSVGQAIANVLSTITYDFQSLNQTINGHPVNVTIADTSGQEKYHSGSLAAQYYRDAKACLLVYDITKRDTFDAVKTVWCKKIKDHAPNASCILVGNKCDKPDNERQVSTEDGQMLADNLNIPFSETSATEPTNVEHVFDQVIQEAYYDGDLKVTGGRGETVSLQVQADPGRQSHGSRSCC